MQTIRHKTYKHQQHIFCFASRKKSLIISLLDGTLTLNLHQEVTKYD